jgi:hypothetical protein
VDIESVQSAHEEELMAAPGVVGVAVGRHADADVILVLVESLTSDNDTPEKLGVPRVLDGFPVVVSEVGRISAPPES